MDDKKALQDDQLDEVTGGVLGGAQDGSKKSLIRSMYDDGSVLEIGMEKEIEKFDKAVSDLFHTKK